MNWYCDTNWAHPMYGFTSSARRRNTADFEMRGLVLASGVVVTVRVVVFLDLADDVDGKDIIELASGSWGMTEANIS